MSRARFGWAGRGARSERRFRAGFSGGVAQPPVTSNLYAWYDASAVNGLFAANPTSDGSALSAWKDLSGNGRDLAQATAAYQPLFRNASRNLLSYNQGATCEDGTITNSLQYALNATVTASTTQALYGNYSVLITPQVASGNSQVGTLRTFGDGTTGTPVVAGQTYTGMVSARSGLNVRGCLCRIYWWKSNGSASTVKASSSGTQTNNSTSAWTQYTVTDSAPSDAAYATVALRVDAITATTDIHYADQFGLFDGTVTTWVPPVTLLNSLPTVQFDGSNDSLTSGTTYQNGVPYSVYVVAARDGIAVSGNEQYLWSLRDAGKNGLRGLLTTSTSTTSTWQGAVVATSGTPTSATTASSALGTPYVFTSIYSGTSLQLSNIAAGFNGTMTSSSSTALMTSASSQIYVGGLGLAGTLSGRIFAVLIYSAAHDTTTRQSIERWLGAKYGITVA
jgi:hypothetical protein